MWIIIFWLLSLPAWEELLYSVKYGFMNAGEIKLEYKRDSLNYIKCEEETKGVFSFIFKVKDWYESISDSNFTTLKFEKDIQEGNYKRHQCVYIKDGKGIYQDGDTVDVIANTKDIINLLYWLRIQDFVVGDTVIIPLHSDKKNNEVKARVEMETVDGKACFVLVPDLSGMKAFGSEGGLILYYDKSKVPIMLKIKFLWGYLEAKLKHRKWK